MTRSIAAAIALLAVGAGAARAPQQGGLPHGMLPRLLDVRSMAVHEAVVGAKSPADEAEACGARLDHLRDLVAKGRHEAAIDLAFALHEHPGGRPAHAHCQADAAHIGEGTLATRIARSLDAEKPSAVDSFVRLHRQDGDEASEAVLPIALGEKRAPLSKARAPVVGFSLDGRFVLADAQARCRADGEAQSSYAAAVAAAAAAHAGGTGLRCDGGAVARGAAVADGHEARRLMTMMGSPLIPDIPSLAAMGPEAAAGLVDATTGAVVGVKSILVIPVVPNGGNPTDACCTGFNYGLVASVHGGSIESYLDAVMQKNSDYFKSGSWDTFSLDWTQTPTYALANYDAATCGSYNPLGFYGGGTTTDSIDLMAIDAAANGGYLIADYSFCKFGALWNTSERTRQAAPALFVFTVVSTPLIFSELQCVEHGLLDGVACASHCYRHHLHAKMQLARILGHRLGRLPRRPPELVLRE